MMKSRASDPIGVFDSGVGGLTVAREIMRQMPNERIVYFGDTARVPYGSKSQDTIIRYARQIIRFMVETQGVKMIVIACNTASAYALATVQREFDLPILGVVEPGARAAVAATRNKIVGVIGTEGTIGSEVYERHIHALDPDIRVIGKACPLFCPLVEEGLTKDPVTTDIANRYLTSILEQDIDSLILGCTHYPLLRDTLLGIVGDDVTLVNPAYEMAMEVMQKLGELGLKSEGRDPSAKEPYRFFVSDTARKFKDFANSILPVDVNTIEKIDIEEY